MVQAQLLEELDQEVKADSTYAQILIKITPSSKTYEEAKKIIEELGVHIIEAKQLSAQWMLLKLDVMDMRNVVLKLTENGFLNMKGINALPSGNK